jgi:hypothetical protein
MNAVSKQDCYSKSPVTITWNGWPRAVTLLTIRDSSGEVKAARDRIWNIVEDGIKKRFLCFDISSASRWHTMY